MLQTEPVVEKKAMANSGMRERIGGAPEWVHEFLQRIEERDDVRDAVVKAEYERTHQQTMASLSDLSESVGKLGGDVGRVDKKVDGLRSEMLATRKDVADHGTRLAALEHQLHEVHSEIDHCKEKLSTLESEMERLRKQDGG